MKLIAHEFGPQHWIVHPEHREDLYYHGNTKEEAVGRFVLDKQPDEKVEVVNPIKDDRYWRMVELIRTV